MTLNKWQANVAFSLVVAGLALTAATSLYRNLTQRLQTEPPNQATSNGRSEHESIESAAQEIDALEKMSAKDPGNAAYLTQIANIYHDLGSYGKAADFYQKSLHIHPQDPHAETDLAVCFYYLHEHDRALETLNHVLDYAPGFSPAMFNKGIVLAGGQKNYREAIALWEELLKRDPEFSRKVQLKSKIEQLKSSARSAQETD